jgi:hypothetical protein
MSGGTFGVIEIKYSTTASVPAAEATMRGVMAAPFAIWVQSAPALARALTTGTEPTYGGKVPAVRLKKVPAVLIKTSPEIEGVSHQ